MKGQARTNNPVNTHWEYTTRRKSSTSGDCTSANLKTRTYSSQNLKADSTAESTKLVKEGVRGEESASEADRSDFGDVDNTLGLDQAIAHAREDLGDRPDLPAGGNALDSDTLGSDSPGLTTYDSQEDGQPCEDILSAYDVAQAINQHCWYQILTIHRIGCRR